MSPHYTFQYELEKLNKKLMRLSTLVEDRVHRAGELIETFDREMAQALILSDYEIDEMEIEIEEHCLKILALHQPVAKDLRFLIAVIKINTEMERIADIAVNIAKRVDNVAKFRHAAAIPYDFSPMARTAAEMLRKSIDALIKQDASMARSLFHDDDIVDNARNRCYEDVKERIRKDPENPGYHINTYLMARHFERIADRAVNIAEEVIYVVEGTITRNN